MLYRLTNKLAAVLSLTKLTMIAHNGNCTTMITYNIESRTMITHNINTIYANT